MSIEQADQEYLRLKVQKWEKDSPNSHFYFRPHTESTEDNKLNKLEQTLLYVHQEPWQQTLMVKYGNTISLMDATYKTTKYELALFFIAVKTNVEYTAVADFVLQSETAKQIREALQILSPWWNPTWQPPYFMVDYSEAEIEAIQGTFPACKVYLCDFH